MYATLSLLSLVRPATILATKVQTLRLACSGLPAVDETVGVGPDGRFSRRFALRENDVWLVELRPL